jgi:hypothetical protein
MPINAHSPRQPFIAPGQVVGVALALGVALGPASASSAAAVECFAPVTAVSHPEKGAQGDFSPNILFSQVPLSARSVGYGAAGGRSDEITIADGRLYLVRPDGAGGARTRHGAADGEGAFMLQIISPAAWSRRASLKGVTSLDELGKRLDDAVAKAGCPNGARLAFRIEGRVKAATWSLDTLPTRAQLNTLARPVVIVGLYTTLDGPRHAMPDGRRFHAHIVIPVTDAAGHLQTVALEDGAKLWLQRP